MTFESGFKTTLAAKLEAAATSMSVATAPTVTAGRVFLQSGTQRERIKFTGVSGSTLTGLTRQLSTTADPATSGGDGYTWLAGTEVKLVAMHDQLTDEDGDNTRGGTQTFADIAFTGTTTGGLKVKSLTTAQRDAATNIANGHIIYNTTDGEFQIYQGGAWSTVSSGSTQPDASTTVAGKVEKATDAQLVAGTAAGETGAPLFASPDDLAQQVQSQSRVNGTDAGGDDTYVFALTPTLAAYTSNQVFNCKVTTTNTGACSADFGPGALAIKTRDGNDPQSGAIRANSVFQLMHNGTNFTLLSEDFATATLKGIVEMATDAEATTGTDQTRYINPKQAKDNYETLVNAVTGTRNAAGAESIAHGLSRTPKMVLSFYTSGTRTGNGMYADGAQRGQYIIDAGQAASTSFLLYTASGNDGAVTGIDGTNLSVTRTDNGDATTYTLVFIA